MKEPCAVCNKTGSIVERFQGHPICANCYYRRLRYDYRRFEKCSCCGFLRYVQRRDKDKQPICTGCASNRYRQTNQEFCVLCKRKHSVASRNENGEPICPGCHGQAYRHELTNHRQCFNCQKITVIVYRNDDGKGYCQTCYHKLFHKAPMTECKICKQMKKILANGLCLACYSWRRRNKPDSG